MPEKLSVMEKHAVKSSVKNIPCEQCHAKEQYTEK
jgi:hypothetical protein